jgi:hypothetical protein
VKTVVLATLAFAIFRAAPSAALTLALAIQGSHRPDPLGDVLVAVYLAALSASLSTLGFLVTTALSATWRGLAPRRAALIAGVLGLLAPIVSLVVTALTARALLPLFHSAPWLAIGLFNGLPGVALGVIALAIARAWRPRPAAVISR